MADVIFFPFPGYLQFWFCNFFCAFFPAICKLWNSPRFYDINVPAAWSTNIPRKNILHSRRFINYTREHTTYKRILKSFECSLVFSLSFSPSFLSCFLSCTHTTYTLFRKASTLVLSAFRQKFEARANKGSRRREILQYFVGYRSRAQCWVRYYKTLSQTWNSRYTLPNLLKRAYPEYKCQIFRSKYA